MQVIGPLLFFVISMVIIIWLAKGYANIQIQNLNSNTIKQSEAKTKRYVKEIKKKILKPYLLFPFIITLILLIASLADLDYGYYTFLRICVSAFCVYCLFHLIKVYGKQSHYYIIHLIILILYNPLFRVHLDKDAWVVINFVTMPFIWLPFFFRQFRESILGE